MAASPTLTGTVVHSQQVSARRSSDALPTVSLFTENFVVIGMSNGEISVFDTQGARKSALSVSQVGGGIEAVWALAVQGDMLASGGSEGLVEIWDLATGKHQKSLHGHTSTVRSLAILSDKKRVISGSRDSTIRMWDVTEANCTALLTTHTEAVRTTALSSDENLLLSGSHDRTAGVCRVTDSGLVLLHTLRGHDDALYRVAFAEAGVERALTASLDTTIRVWDVKDGTCLKILQGHSALVNQLVCTNLKLISSDSSGVICIWSLDNIPELIHRIEAHRFSVTGSDSDGAKILSGGADGSAVLLDLESGQQLGQLRQQAKIEALYKVAFLRGGRVALVVFSQGSALLQIWDIN